MPPPPPPPNPPFPAAGGRAPGKSRAEAAAAAAAAWIATAARSEAAAAAAAAATAVSPAAAVRAPAADGGVAECSNIGSAAIIAVGAAAAARNNERCIDRHASGVLKFNDKCAAASAASDTPAIPVIARLANDNFQGLVRRERNIAADLSAESARATAAIGTTGGTIGDDVIGASFLHGKGFDGPGIGNGAVGRKLGHGGLLGFVFILIYKETTIHRACYQLIIACRSIGMMARLRA